MVENGYSLSDLAAVNGNNGFGGNSWFIIVLFLFAMMNGGWGGYGRGDYGQYATAASQQEILFGQHFQNIDNKIDRLGNGIADATFALNNAITTEGRTLQMSLANDTANLTAAIHAEGEATRKMMYEDKIGTLQGQINNLQLQNAMCGVVKYPNGWTYNAGTSPFCNCGGCGCNG